MTTETIRQYDPWAGEWRDVQVEVPDAPRRRSTRRARTRRQGAPRNLAGLSDGAPFPAWWRDTAFGLTDAGPLADTRSYIEASAMRTHRAAVTLPADPGRITVTR